MFCKSKKDPRGPRTSGLDKLTFKNDSLEFPDSEAVAFMKATAPAAREDSAQFYQFMKDKLSHHAG
jgi:hypothetical protein